MYIKRPSIIDYRIIGIKGSFFIYTFLIHQIFTGMVKVFITDHGNSLSCLVPYEVYFLLVVYVRIISHYPPSIRSLYSIYFLIINTQIK